MNARKQRELTRRERASEKRLIDVKGEEDLSEVPLARHGTSENILATIATNDEGASQKYNWRQYTKAVGLLIPNGHNQLGHPIRSESNFSAESL